MWLTLLFDTVESHDILSFMTDIISYHSISIHPSVHRLLCQTRHQK